MLNTMLILVLQSPVGLDPTPWSAWGVLGLLGLIVIALMGIIWRLFNKQTSTMEVRDKLIMDFVNTHRSETTRSMQDVAKTVSDSYDKMSVNFSRQARALNEILLANRVLDRIEKMKASGAVMTPAEIESLVRSIFHDWSSASIDPK